VTTPKPAVVPQRAVQRLPRLALLLFCAAYVLPGVFGRDPWKNADVTAVGYMMSLTRGDASWWAPTLGGLPADGGVIPYWLGAGAIQLLSPWVDPVLAARLPFALLLLAVLALVWYATFHLARTDAAQPVAFAFGGEAQPVDYARAIADGSVLAMIASLGLLQLGHETTPELVQLAATALALYAAAAAPWRGLQARIAALIALPALAASGAATGAVLLGAGLALVCGRSRFDAARAFVPWLVTALGLALGVATWLGAWTWRLEWPTATLPRLLAWFTWPVWPLALWTLWRWRRHLGHRHLAVPVAVTLVGFMMCTAMGGSDRALMMALPGLAVLAAFALPTLQRSVSAAVDWFSVFFFTLAAATIWVIYAAMHTGVPAKPAANVLRLAPGFEARFDVVALLLAGVGSALWLALVVWRTGRHRHPLWKSLVLPAGGVALCWLLLMTLWLPLLDYARSYRPLTQRLAATVPADACFHGPALTRAQVAALEVLGGWRVQPVREGETDCAWWLRPPGHPGGPTDWLSVGRFQRPTDRNEVLELLRRP
jgi:4-amino-4-deoxy-L-arabinose transferase-like glycosyltransferase